MVEQGSNIDVYFKPAAKVLVIDDSQLNRSFIVNTFLPPNYEILTAIDGIQGLEIAKNEVPELILLDIMMPNMDGFEVCKYLKNDPVTKDIPIIFITALDAIQDKLRAFETGGADFVTKPFNHKELLARVKTNVAFKRASVEKERVLRFAMEEKQHEAIVRIAAGVTHNFNNMLGVAFGNIMLVESLIGNNSDPVVNGALKDVRSSLERMQALVKKFLILTDRANFNQDVVAKNNLHALIEEIISNSAIHFGPKLKSNLDFENATDDSISFMCNESHAREIFYLIITESIEITIDNPVVAVTNQVTDDQVTVSVLFQNFPISSEVIDAIFEPFALPLQNVGTGLAYAVAKQLVDKNDGTITASSPGEEMLQFDITFPRA